MYLGYMVYLFDCSNKKVGFDVPSAVFLITGGSGTVEVTGTSALDKLELLEHVVCRNCVDDSSVAIVSSLGIGTRSLDVDGSS